MQVFLIIEDDKAVAAVLAEQILEAIADCRCEILGFDTPVAQISEHRPDAIILDLMEGLQSTNLPGQKTWRSLWDGCFCPVVIYTGWEGEIAPPVQPDHPFAKVIRKGAGSPALVIRQLQDFAPAIQAVTCLRSEVDKVIQQVLRDTAGSGVIPTTDTTYLLHAGRRRIAASMDDSTLTGQRQMTSWEQYLIPAIGDSPLTADLLRRHGAQWDDPSAHRLVLTPSCDLVKDRCELTLLTACCEGPWRLAKKLSLSLAANRLDKDAESVVAKVLNAGSFAGFLPLPAFPARLPVMVANLKELEVIPYRAIGRTDGTQPTFDRIASIDSPFREQVAWAYLTTAARPGMPERDLRPWAEELVKVAAAQAAAQSLTDS